MAPFMDYTLSSSTSSSPDDITPAQEDIMLIFFAILPVLLLGLVLIAGMYLVIRARPCTACSAKPSLSRLSLWEVRADGGSPLLPAGRVVGAAGGEMDSAPPTPTLVSLPLGKDASDSSVLPQRTRKSKDEDRGSATELRQNVEGELLMLRDTEAYRTQPIITEASKDEASTSLCLSQSFRVLVDPPSKPKQHVPPAAVPAIRVFSSTGNITELAVGLTSFSSAERLCKKRAGAVLEPLSGTSARKLRHRHLQCVGVGKENAVLGHSISVGNVCWTPVLRAGMVQQSMSMPNIRPSF